MRVISWSLTDVGRKREHNEDSFLVDTGCGLFVVADGMGGHAGGDRASRLAVTLLHDETMKSALVSGEDGVGPGEEPMALRLLRDAAKRAGQTIFDLAQENPHLSGMGTTLTALLVHNGRAYLAHVGDSRAYLFRDGKIEQLSEDHSWINEQVKAGLITEEDAKTSKFKHIITRSVGFERDVTVDLMSFPVLMGDCYLLCSDGLSNYIDAAELGRLLTSNFYSRVPQLLIDLANDRGGDDNITIVLIYVANDAAEKTTPPVRGPTPHGADFANEETNPDLGAEAEGHDDALAAEQADVDTDPALTAADDENPALTTTDPELTAARPLDQTDPALPAYDPPENEAGDPDGSKD